MTNREVMQMALEALQCSLPFHETVQRLGAHNKAITALRAALEQPEQEPVCPECNAPLLYECVACSRNNYPPKQQAEPVAYCYVKKGSSADALTFDPNPADAVSDTVFPLYAAPPQRKPLTIKEINDMPQAQGYWPIGMNDRIVRLIRAIEAAHGIGEKT